MTATKGTDLRSLGETLDASFPPLTQAKAARARITIIEKGLRDGWTKAEMNEVIREAGVHPDQLEASRFAESAQ